MDRDEVLDWIDSVGKEELVTPPVDVKPWLDRDIGCRRYYEISLSLMQLKAEVDLLSRFRNERVGRESVESKKTNTRRVLWSLGVAAAAAAIAVLFFIFIPGKTKNNYLQELVYHDPIELTVEISDNFSITVGTETVLQMSALDYYYAVAMLDPY